MTAIGSARTRYLGQEKRSAGEISPGLKLAIYAMIFLFYIANMYASTPQHVFSALKWAPLVVLLPLCASLAPRSALGSGTVPILVLVPIAFSVVLADAPLRAAEYFSSILFVVVTGWFLAAYLRVGNRRLEFLRILQNVGTVVVLSAAACWLLHINLGRGGDRFSAWTDNPNTLGLLLAPYCVILIGRILQPGRRLRRAEVVFALIGFFLIVDTGSRASMLWVAVSGMVFWLARRGAGLAIFVSAAALLVFAFWSDQLMALMLDYWKYRVHDLSVVPAHIDLLSGRDELWQLGLNLWRHRPWLGFGVGSEEKLITESSWLLAISQGGHFHNSYLSVLVESGIIGLAGLLIALVVTLARSGRRLLSKCGTRAIGSEWWPQVVPFALAVGAIAHAYFETWLLNGGNANTLIFWTLLCSVAIGDALPGAREPARGGRIAGAAARPAALRDGASNRVARRAGGPVPRPR